ncbi:hypothetical protein M9458_025023, partial [Cirrhinus mrigala]
MTVNQSYYFWAELPDKTASFRWDFGDGFKKEGQNQSHVFCFPGRFRVTATASNVIKIEVLAPLSYIVVNTSQPFVEAGKEILLTAQTDVNENVMFYWMVNPLLPPQLGTSTFVHVFPKAGVFQIKVTAQNLISRVESITHIEVVERVHEVQIHSQGLQDARYFLTNQTVLLTASVTCGSNLTYEWTANQRIASNSKQFPLFTNSPGDIHITLVVSNVLGSVDTKLSLRAVELVSGLSISSPTNAVAKGKPVRISASVSSGTDLRYSWFLDSERSPVISDVPFVLHVFEVVGVVRIRVSVSNVFGSDDATKLLIIQENISKVDFQINGQFKPFFVRSNSLVLLHGSAGTGNVLHWEWVLIFHSRIMVLADNQTVSYSFADVGDHRISLNASNDISWQTVSNTITVEDAIQGFLLMASSDVVCEDDSVTFTPSVSQGIGNHLASKNISFQASSGSQANYRWTFLLNGVRSSREIGQNVHFTPFTNGSLSVTVEADNGFCSQSLTSIATIQKHVKKVKLFTSNDGAFVDYPITFVAITDGGSNLKFRWNFGDGKSNRQVHKYNVT